MKLIFITPFKLNCPLLVSIRMFTFQTRVISILIVILAVGFNLSAQNQYHVYFFLLEDCKITQAYVPEIKKLKAEFAVV